MIWFFENMYDERLVCPALVTPVTTSTKMVIATRLSTMVNPLLVACPSGRRVGCWLLVILDIKGALGYGGLQGEVRSTLAFCAGMTFDHDNHLGLEIITGLCAQNIESQNKVVNNNLWCGDCDPVVATSWSYSFFNSSLRRRTAEVLHSIGNLVTVA